MQPKGIDIELEIEKHNAVEVEKDNILEIEGDNPSDGGDNWHCVEANSDGNGDDKENNNSNNTANEDQSATTAVEAVEVVLKMETQQQGKLKLLYARKCDHFQGKSHNCRPWRNSRLVIDGILCTRISVWRFHRACTHKKPGILSCMHNSR